MSLWQIAPNCCDSNIFWPHKKVYVYIQNAVNKESKFWSFAYRA